MIGSGGKFRLGGGRVMAIRIDGYSERGIVNAVCEDIIRADDLHQLTAFLSWCSFPFQKQGVPDFSGITDARILVEQGFSDFGDLDLLILLDHADRKQAVLIEAKVATDTPKRVDDQWDDFLSFLEGVNKHTSSLFVQIYRKLRLIERVADLNRPFNPHPIWGRQSLGANRIVLKAARLLSEYRANPWYIVFVPDDSNRVSRFFSDKLDKFCHDPQQLPGWDVTRMGYLTWPDLHKKVQDDPDRENKWKRSLSAFDWNEHQIYQRLRTDCESLGAGTVALWNEQRVIIVAPGERMPRAIAYLPDIHTEYFPKSFPVRVEEVTPLEEPSIEIRGHQPKRDSIYNWNPPNTEECQPSDRAPVPTPPKLVKVREAGWKTTRVVQVDAAGVELGDEFHVFPHHLQRRAS